MTVFACFQGLYALVSGKTGSSEAFHASTTNTQSTVDDPVQFSRVLLHALLTSEREVYTHLGVCHNLCFVVLPGGALENYFFLSLERDKDFNCVIQLVLSCSDMWQDAVQTATAAERHMALIRLTITFPLQRKPFFQLDLVAVQHPQLDGFPLTFLSRKTLDASSARVLQVLSIFTSRERTAAVYYYYYHSAHDHCSRILTGGHLIFSYQEEYVSVCKCQIMANMSALDLDTSPPLSAHE